MQEWIIQLVSQHTYLVYAAIVILACAEGPILSMMLGVLIRLGYFNFLPVYLALMVGDLIGDVGWYYIGFRFGHPFIKRFGKYFSLTEEKVAKVIRIFHKYKHRVLFISKISNGFGFALVTLIAAGLARIPFRRYLAINVIGQLIWTGILLGVGYLFGNMYLQVNTWFERMAIVAIFVVVILALWGYKKYLATLAENMNI